MSTLREIRKKLRSIENIKKITQAMEMVAASRLRLSQQKAEKARPYLHKLQEILNALLLTSNDLTHPLIQSKQKDKTGLMVIAGDRGLCGSYNNVIFSSAAKFLQNYDQKEIELFLVGQKAVNHFSKKQWKIRKNLVNWGGKLSFHQIKQLTDELIQAFLFDGLHEIWIIYSRFQTLMTRQIVVEKFLNVEIPDFHQQKPLNYIFEPNEQEIFADLLPKYCISKMNSIFNEAFTSELAARIFAMRAATKNAEEMTKELTVERNKVRQTGITRELIEITSGAN